MAMLTLTILVPLALAAGLSLTEYNLFEPPRFVGLDNYRKLFTDPIFYQAIGNTLYFALGQVLIGVVVAFGVAMLFNHKLVLGGTMRTIVYLPQAMSYVTVALLWTFLYDPFIGPINIALRAAGIDTIYFLTSTELAMPAIMAMSLWRNLGYFMIILLAGLKAVPEEMIEAAHLDGAGWWCRLRHVIIPQMLNPLFFVTVTWFMGGLQMFTQAYVMTQGGPVNSTRTIVYQMYEASFTRLDIGTGCAIAVLLFLVVMAVALPVRYAGELRERRTRNG
ncbi:sugar ABC transporter permease [Dermabacteraceae bacterium TAE3-ERU27]|nr:sugar ABC transporter permease [Dermabacteraceae bacterium TAE3-ERU27]